MLFILVLTYTAYNARELKNKPCSNRPLFVETGGGNLKLGSFDGASNNEHSSATFVMVSETFMK